jgi:hypothetical protein
VRTWKIQPCKKRKENHIRVLLRSMGETEAVERKRRARDVRFARQGRIHPSRTKSHPTLQFCGARPEADDPCGRI